VGRVCDGSIIQPNQSLCQEGRRVEDGDWRLEVGGWKVEVGRWRTGDEGRGTKDGGWMASGAFLLFAEGL
jgi:hypothetical protein